MAPLGYSFVHWSRNGPALGSYVPVAFRHEHHHKGGDCWLFQLLSHVQGSVRARILRHGRRQQHFSEHLFSSRTLDRALGFRHSHRYVPGALDILFHFRLTSCESVGSDFRVLRISPPNSLARLLNVPGELPPYFITRAAKRAGKRASDFENELAEARAGTDLVSKLKVWTIDFTDKHGFVGILALASWPNAAFDMCGMACGWLEVSDQKNGMFA